ncbi:hypothetical protein M8J77_022398 [Diaphorina citri]|nr:hypothetical protein M8J77_022398 [Diaphorina citri]
MARNYSSTSQSNTGFWEPYDGGLSEYKKPSCDDKHSSGKKKKNNKKSKPTPVSASLFFSSGVEASSKHPPNEAPSGPNAWSLKSGSALFKEPPPEEQRRQNSHSHGHRSGRFSPYYPEPQAEDLDEEEQLKKAIEESMRTAQEEEERKKKQEKEEEEWLAKLCAELKDDQEARKKTNNYQNANKKKSVQKYTGDSTDSDDFLPISVPLAKSSNKTKAPPPKPAPKSALKKTNPAPRPVENYAQKHAENLRQKQKHTEQYSQKNTGQRQNENFNQRITDNPKKEPERHPFREMKEDKKITPQTSRIPKNFSNLYDNYDDSPDDEQEEEIQRQTFWPSKNESHKWNQDTWGHPEIFQATNKTQENEMPKGQRIRNTSKTSAGSTNSKPRDFKQNDPCSASPVKSRNFKLDLFKNQNSTESQDAPGDSKKHVKFSSVQSEHSNSENETSGFRTSNFASSKSTFDESLYSNYAQRGNMAQPTRNNKPSNIPRTNVSRSVRKDDMHSLNEKETKNTWNSRQHVSANDMKHKVESKIDKKQDQDDLVQAMDDMELNNLDPALQDTELNNLEPAVQDELNNLEPNSDSSTPSETKSSQPEEALNVNNEPSQHTSHWPNDVRATVREEIKAEVKLPQDNNIYNFYLKKQLGIHNTQDHLVTHDQYGYSSHVPPDRTPPENSLEAFMGNYRTMESKAGIPHNTNTSYTSVSSASSHPIVSSTSQQIPTSYNMYSAPHGDYSLPVYQHGYSLPQPPTQQDSFGLNYFLDTQLRQSQAPPPSQVPYPVPYLLAQTPQYPTSSTPLPTDPFPTSSTPLPVDPFPTCSTPLPPESSSATTLKDNATWKLVLQHAENNPVLLEKIIHCLNKSIVECKDPGELATLIAMNMEVDTAVRKLQQRQLAMNLQSNAADMPETPAEIAGFVPVPGQDKAVVGRGRGKRLEPPRDHVMSSPGPGRGRGFIP